MNGWIYLFGEANGVDIKIGKTNGETLRKRLEQVNAEQMSDGPYVVLAGARGDAKDESALKRRFAHAQRDDKNRTEYFRPVPELVDYANWLRQWWWVAIDQDTPIGTLDPMAPEMWMPGDGRELPHPPYDQDRLIQRWEVLDGPLAGTPWNWMLSPKASFQDYFTPFEIVDAARQAMGGLDLDAASHPVANRTLRVPDYFHVNRSAFEHDWYGRVWLNPPYGNNAPWFRTILQHLETGALEQLCMLSPVWAFTTEIAMPVMELSAAAIFLAPTPKFWGNSEGRTGKNHPHAVIYWGDRIDEFVTAFTPHGIPATIAWDRVRPIEGNDL